MTKPGANIDAVAALWAQGLTSRVIGERLGIGQDAVLHIARQNRNRCPARREGRPPQQDAQVVDRAARMWVQGHSATEIGAALGVTRNVILGFSARHRERFPMRDTEKRGEAGPAPVRPSAIPRTTIRGVSLPVMSWDRREATRPNPSD